VRAIVHSHPLKQELNKPPSTIKVYVPPHLWSSMWLNSSKTQKKISRASCLLPKFPSWFFVPPFPRSYPLIMWRKCTGSGACSLPTSYSSHIFQRGHCSSISSSRLNWSSGVEILGIFSSSQRRRYATEVRNDCLFQYIC